MARNFWRDAIVVFVDLIKAELGKNEQRSKLLFDTVKQLKQEQDAASKDLQERLDNISNTPQKKIVTTSLSQPLSMFFFSLQPWLYPLLSPFGAI